ncbi:MAG: flagellar export protein FliJ [Pseudomonadota bacterium]
MKRSKRLEPIVEMAESRESDARQRLGKCQVKKRELLEKVDALKRYRNDYSFRLELIGSNGLNAKQYNDYRTFLGKLNRAIEEQETVLEKIEKELQNHEKAWAAARQYMTSLRKVHASSLTEEIKTLEHREQREADDRAARKGHPNFDVEMAGY